MARHVATLLMTGGVFLLVGSTFVQADDAKPLTMDGHKYYLHVPRSVGKVSSNDTRATTKAGLLLWLHSGGIGAKDQFAWWIKSKQFDDDVILLCPEATEIAKGWDMGRDMKFVRGVFEQTVKDYGVASSNVVIAGHSQGGAYAWWLALQMQDKIGAILACKCLAPLPPPPAEKPKPPRTLWYYSDNDPYAPMAKPVESKAQLEKAGYAIEVFKDNLQHALGPKAQELHALLRKRIAGQDKLPDLNREAIGDTQKPNGVSIAYLVADAVNFGSTAFRIADPKLTVYIEAFPTAKDCKLDPKSIEKADLIIQNVHGHASHYDPDVCAMVARNTGAYVLGNAQLKKDMLARKVADDKIVELSPALGAKATKKIEALNVTVTAFGMEHTMMPGVKVDTFLVEMPNGIKWYHGTCSSGAKTMAWMAKHAELKNLDVMILDCDMAFASVKKQFQPRLLIKDHDFQSQTRPAPATVYVGAAGIKTLSHNEAYEYSRGGVSDPTGRESGP
ncbi:MAG: hypothetical protein WCS01_13070 [bacterium]